MDPVITAFLEQIENMIFHYREVLASGQAEDFAQYREICGKVEGLTLALREMKELISKAEGN